MMEIAKCAAAVLTVSLLVACGGGAVEHTEAKKDTPKALQDKSSDITSSFKYSRGGSDLVNDLYSELVEKNPALKKLEDDLIAYNDKPNEAMRDFNNYDGKSEQYYRNAKNHLSGIGDSALRKKMDALIKASSDKYETKTNGIGNLISTINKNAATLADHHNVLKVVLTLPMIEKYQNENLPPQKSFNELIKEQQKLILEVDKQTPQF